MPEFYGKLEQLILFRSIQFNPRGRVYYSYWPSLYLRTGMEPRHA